MQTTHQTIFKTLERAKAPLLVVGDGSGADGFASAMGFAHLLERLEKPVHIVTADPESFAHLQFLHQEHAKEVKPRLEQLQTTIIRLNTKRVQPKSLSYDTIDDVLHIFLEPKSGSWTEEDLSFDHGAYRFDLIICLGAKDLESCGAAFDDHPDFFYRTPIINIDHNPHNEHFGHVNLVDMTATSLGEICHDLLHTVATELLDTPIATAFLTGMIAKTKSFRSGNVTPKTLQVASALMARGAERDKAVHHLYRTRSVETLRLWGRALARLKSAPELGLAWTLLSQQDFLHAGTDETALSGVAEELISTSPDTHVALLIYEDPEGHATAILHTRHPNDAIVLSMPFRPSGTHEEAHLYLPGKRLVEAEHLLVDHLKKQLTK